LCGIDFDRHTTEGIDVQDFAELLMSSGIVLDAGVHWISFHGSYDFGYFLKILTCQPLPDEEDQFFDLLRAYFPSLYDIKFLLRSVDDLRPTWGSSLNRLADYMNVQRVGQEHQAGSDSLVTCITFFKLIDIHFSNQIDDSKFCGQIYGLGEGASAESSQALDSHRSPSPLGVPNGHEASVNGVKAMTLGLVDSMGQQYPLSTMSNPAIHVNSGPRPMYA
jgi:CCR4-NOT transcription complex subunit 7/8